LHNGGKFDSFFIRKRKRTPEDHRGSPEGWGPSGWRRFSEKGNQGRDLRSQKKKIKKSQDEVRSLSIGL